MRIGYDVRPFLKEETGVGVYFKNLLQYLSRIDRVNEYFLFSSSWKDRISHRKIPTFEVGHFRDFRIPVKAINFLWSKLSWPLLDTFFRTELDLTHSPTPLIVPTKGRTIVTVYDLFFMDFPELADRQARRDFFRKAEASFRKADGIITISEFTKNELLEKFTVEESKVRVVYLGVDHKAWDDISAAGLEKIRAKYELPATFLLFVGAIEPRKNLLRLIQAFTKIHKEYESISLVIVGRRGQEFKKLADEIERQSLQPWVKMLGYVPESDLMSLYHLASLLVFPSLCEGFGLPVLEAMTSGLPVVASLSSALPEIAEDAALYFDPENPDEMAEKILQVLQNQNLCETLRDRGLERSSAFHWEKTASETLNFYQEVAGR